MTGRRKGGFDNKKYMVEFKYFSNTSADKQKIMSMETPAQEDVSQIKGYADDSLRQFPGYEIVLAVVYIAGNKGFRFFMV